MKIVVIGYTSMLGQRLLSSFDSKHEIVTCGRNSEAGIYLDLQTQDLTLPNNIPQDIDVIIHCAASFFGNSIEDFFWNETINSVGVVKVGMLAEKLKCKHIVHISSISTYDRSENQYFDSYGMSKKHGQENLSYICKRLGVAFTALLPSQIYDDKGKARHHQGLLYHFVDCAREGKDIHIFGNRDALRNYLYIDDLVNVIDRVVRDRITGVFPCVHPRNHTLSEIAELAFEVFGNGGSVQYLRDRPDIPDIYIPQEFELYERMQCFPEIDLKKGLALIKDRLTI